MQRKLFLSVWKPKYKDMAYTDWEFPPIRVKIRIKLKSILIIKSMPNIEDAKINWAMPCFFVSEVCNFVRKRENRICENISRRANAICRMLC